jgi:hypothetical protein
MFKSSLKSLILLAFLLAACGGSDTATPTSPTEPVVPVLNTAVPPTQPVLPSPTLPPPTPTELPTPEVTPDGNTWMKYYGGNHDDMVESIILAEDGGFYLAGEADSRFNTGTPGEAYLLRLDSSGEILWEQTYADYGGFQAIRPTGDGGLLISGVTASPAGDNSDIFLLEVDQDGNVLWSKTFGGPLDEFGAAWPMEDGGYILGGIVVDPEDIVVDDPGVAGYGGFSGRSNVYLARIDAQGNELWSQTIGGEDNVMTSAGLMTADSGFLILANILNYPQFDDDIILIKIDQDGNEIWSHTWEEGGLDGNALIQTSDGNYLIAGGYALGGETDMAQKDFMFIKVDPDGNELWQSVFGDPQVYDWAYAVAETADGGFIALGDLSRDMFTWDGDIILVKLDAQGQLIWQQTYDTNTHTMLRGVLEHPQGGYVLVGSSYRGGDFDILVIKTDAEGNLDR